MNRWIVLALCVIPGLAAAERTLDPVHPKSLPKVEVKFHEDGDDLIVSTMVTIYDAPHVVLTSVDPAEIYPPILRYTVIQNANHWLEGRKTVPVEWRFKGMNNAHWRPRMIKGQWLVLYTDELKQLGGVANKLSRDW